MSEGLSTPESPENLERKANLLRESPLFVNPSRGAELVDKQMIFLAAAGLKPVSEVCSTHFERNEANDGWKSVGDDPEEVGRFLDSLGLHYELYGDDKWTMAAVSLDAGLVADFRAARGSREVGRLLGFPATAVSSFESGDCMPIIEQDHIEASAIEWPFVPFRFSKDHWEAELAVAQQWYGTLVKYRLT